MSQTPVSTARLDDRALIEVRGEDWRSFLQGLLTQDVETLAPGGLRFGALLTPQGRVLFDMFVLGREDGCWIDCDAGRRADLITRLTIYRLRAKVAISALDTPVHAMWGAEPATDGWMADPRLPALGWRRYDDAPSAGPEGDYDAHRLSLGVPGPADWTSDTTYPIEANFDLLQGIDFKKGCFVGQETTSRMKRRGVIKTRMAPIVWQGAAPAFGTELLAGDLRAGQVLSRGERVAMALLRLDRLATGSLTIEGGGGWRPIQVDWMGA